MCIGIDRIFLFFWLFNMNKFFLYCNFFVCIGFIPLAFMDPVKAACAPIPVKLVVTPPPPSPSGDSIASPGGVSPQLVEPFSRFSMTSPPPVAAAFFLGVPSLQQCQTPSRKRATSPVNVSPQHVEVPAENMARYIFQSLTKKVEDEEIEDTLVCADSPEIALSALLGWYTRFPSILTKIKWYIPEDTREDRQQDFKYKLVAALQQTVLRCLAWSSKTKISDPVVFYEENDTCSASIVLGGFVITSSISKATLKAKHSIALKKKESSMPEYNPANRIKSALMGYLFDLTDMSSGFQSVLQEILSVIQSSKRISKEQFYHALIYGLISFMGSNFSIIEAYTGNGRADLLLVGSSGKFSGNQNCIVEFKYKRTAKEAVDQIKSMDYGRYFHQGPVIVVGININDNPFGVTTYKEIIQIKQPEITTTGSKASGTVSWQ